MTLPKLCDMLSASIERLPIASLPYLPPEADMDQGVGSSARLEAAD